MLALEEKGLEGSEFESTDDGRTIAVTLTFSVAEYFMVSGRHCSINILLEKTHSTTFDNSMLHMCTGIIAENWVVIEIKPLRMCSVDAQCLRLSTLGTRFSSAGHVV